MRIEVYFLFTGNLFGRPSAPSLWQYVSWSWLQCYRREAECSEVVQRSRKPPILAGCERRCFQYDLMRFHLYL